jgi:hypothetical protein
VFNLDEIGISEWENYCTRRVIVPSAMKGQTIFHVPSSLETHICCRVDFSCRRTHDTVFVSPQVNPTVETRLKSEGLRRGVDLILKRRSKPYMGSQLFTEYISTVLLPYVDELRSNEKFANKEAVLLRDNCSVYVQGDTLQMLADHRVKVLTFRPHTTHIFQNLELNFFENFKKRENECQAAFGNWRNNCRFH